jgi:hypothetical protein
MGKKNSPERSDEEKLFAPGENQTPIVQPLAYSVYRLIEVSSEVVNETSPKQGILIGLPPGNVGIMKNIIIQSEKFYK